MSTTTHIQQGHPSVDLAIADALDDYVWSELHQCRLYAHFESERLECHMGFEAPAPVSSDLHYAHRMEDIIAKKELVAHYARALKQVLGPAASAANFVFDIAHATARQRAEAALRMVHSLEDKEV